MIFFLCKAQRVVAVCIGDTLLHGRSWFRVGIGGDMLGKSRQGFLFTRERWRNLAAWQLERSWRFLPLRGWMGTGLKTQLPLGVTVFLLLSPFCTFGGNDRTRLWI